MRKKSLILAFLLALTAVVPVHSAAAETVMRSEIALVDVTVPQTGRVVLNPYGLSVAVGGGTSTEQIASETLPIVNNGDRAVLVSASAAGRIAAGSSMSFVTAPPPADRLEKEIFMYAEFQDEDGLWSGGYSGRDNQLLITGAVSQPKQVLALDAGSRGVFRLFGATAVSPADPWSSADAVSVSFTFTFAPVIDPLETVSEEEEPIVEPSEEPIAEPSAPPVEPSEEPVAEPSQPVTEPVVEPSEEPSEPVEPPAEAPAEPSQEPVEDEAQDPVPEAGEEPVETGEEPAP